MVQYCILPGAVQYRGAYTNRNGPERTGTDRNGQEWTSITGTDLKIHPKIHVLSVLDKKFG